MIKPRRVLIVGGGSSGWMAAAYLDAVLNHNGLRVADISLIESPDVPAWWQRTTRQLNGRDQIQLTLQAHLLNGTAIRNTGP